MRELIDRLLDRYERGVVTRRELVGALSVALVPGSSPRAARSRPELEQTGLLRGININHVNLQVSDLDRSVDFYRRLFSLPPRREVPGRPFALDLADGLSFLSVPQRDPTGVIDHFCVGVEDFEPERVGRALQAAGMARDLQVARDFVMVSDPDGIRIQISSPEWDG
jgi:catechol 2,3-dioxygenase-like lactoylglutathione lyase family enzyme